MQRWLYEGSREGSWSSVARLSGNTVAVAESKCADDRGKTQPEEELVLEATDGTSTFFFYHAPETNPSSRS